MQAIIIHLAITHLPCFPKDNNLTAAILDIWRFYYTLQYYKNKKYAKPTTINQLPTHEEIIHILSPMERSLFSRILCSVHF